MGRADLVITTGGLGPTSDDLTRELIAELLGKKLVENKDVLAHIENFFAQRNRPRPAKTSVETFVPEGALVFLNQFGTAPGLAMQIGNRKSEIGNSKWLVMLPGPPRELRPMFDEFSRAAAETGIRGMKFLSAARCVRPASANRACRKWSKAVCSRS